MRRSGFTMVELIFVIIIIGILSVAAIPKFGDIKDRAKVNAEYSSLSGLDSAAIAKMEFYKDDNPTMTNLFIDWHSLGTAGYDAAGSDLTTSYTLANTNKTVLKGIIKKGDDFKIVAYVDAGTAATLDQNGSDDIFFIKGAASNASSGVKKATDVAGKPDKNDVWVFNASDSNATVSYWDGSSTKTKSIESGEMSLIDTGGTTAITFVDTVAGADADAEIAISCDINGVDSVTVTIEDI
jgi:prepilin-type N-terminal cleavage/methylation domain-containing protein